MPTHCSRAGQDRKSTKRVANFSHHNSIAIEKAAEFCGFAAVEAAKVRKLGQTNPPYRSAFIVLNFGVTTGVNPCLHSCLGLKSMTVRRTILNACARMLDNSFRFPEPTSRLQ